MKNLLILLVVAGVALCAPQNSSDTSSEENSSEELLSEFTQFLKGSEIFGNASDKTRNFCPDLEAKIKVAALEVSKCDDKINETLETTCSMVKKFGKDCLKPMVKVLEDCLPEETKSLPSFLVEGAVSAVDYICRSNGEKILELVNVCLYRSLYTSDFEAECNEAKAKVEKVKEGFSKDQPRFPNKSDVCDVLTSARSCSEQFLTRSCLNPLTRDAVMGLYDSFLVPCNNNVP